MNKLFLPLVSVLCACLFSIACGKDSDPSPKEVPEAQGKAPTKDFPASEAPVVSEVSGGAPPEAVQEENPVETLWTLKCSVGDLVFTDQHIPNHLLNVQTNSFEIKDSDGSTKKLYTGPCALEQE